MGVEGDWTAHYARAGTPLDEEGIEEQIAEVGLDQGVITGQDQLCGRYTGQYKLDGDLLLGFVFVTAPGPETVSIFDGVRMSFMLGLVGHYTSPDYFSVRGYVLGNHTKEIVVNLRRAGVT